mmetsp:Transcript_4322/g.5774  ORF Transcript_4322/g.5774 Transcript_4322/m.5774 type:complete len:483 (-) Transcript_4322:112-1560(-)|eukprot:CAMPEP_0196570416 /NCGR_PEP_ID=MMETSP1081-20130531/480_1 /TAXON_ID=36882 /ORGANISM="Pyramimonas amylifera, Strain CCMP720" /LENGTH=482 /DNA_ID=CAMNT_0041886845 /DNA_START=100 /DNA_END=1548 /DNA_ORIENTATION=-
MLQIQNAHKLSSVGSFGTGLSKRCRVNVYRSRKVCSKVNTPRVFAVLSVPEPPLEKQEATWGPDAPEHVAEWRRNLDLKGWGGEMRALERELKAQQGDEDVNHLKGVLMASNACYFVGIALAGVCNPLQFNPVAAFLMSVGIFARWTMVGHHVSHGGYNTQQNGKRFHRSTFGKGIVNRAFDWLDWMLPEAWDVEHNNLHHYKLGELGDPDLVERNLDMIRSQPVPTFLKNIQVYALMATWKWYYYAPNIMKELRESQIARATNLNKEGEVIPEQIFKTKEGQPHTIVSVWGTLFKGDPRSFISMTAVLAPYMLYHFVAVPALFYAIGGPAMAKIAFANMVLAEVVTNVHSFIAIATNHAGEDIYKFTTPVLPKTDEFYLRACIGSTNFRTAATTPFLPKDKPSGFLGNANDFMHGWLNYQIEHHMFPDMSMLSYQKAMPRVKEACERYGVPYVQESVFIRLRKTIDIMVGKTNMLWWERGD